MRNLKRALSLAVASVMLLGLMVVGTGAVNVDDFGDADQIASENQEAVAISVGLGIFAGADGNFLPDQPVTRAEMATIICKMLYGNDVNADNFKGVGTFEDTASYQSGWAEGYINMCASLGIVSGYNETAYGPGDTVTTWQAALMLQRALGYWNAAANESIDELAVTALATQLGFFGDLTLAANTPLAREDVAVMAFNALFAQRVAFDDYRGLYVKANDRNVVVTNGTDDPANTLAQNTYSLYMVEGTVTDNSFTNLNLMSDDRIPAMTTVVFDEVEDIDQNGRATDTEYDFDIETGLDLIGHAVNVYYRLVNGDVEAVAVIDDATLVGTIFAGASADMSRDANALGFRRNTVMSVIDDDAAVLNYDLTETVDANDIGTDTGHSGTYADNKLILISNSSNYQVDYVIVVAQTLDKLDTIDEDDYETVYELENAIPASRGKVVLTDEATQEGDYVLVTAIGGHSDVLVAEPAVVVDASITRLVGRSNNDDSTTLKRVEADGESYTESPVEDAENVSDTTEFQAIVTIGATTLVLDTDGLLVALAEEPEEDIGYAYVAQFGWTRDRTEDGLNYEDKLTALIYYADGESDVRVVDQTDDSVTEATLKNFKNFTEAGLEGLNAFNEKTGKPTDASSIGIYYVIENSNGSVQLQDIADHTTAASKYVDLAGNSWADDLEIIKGHALQMDKNNNVLLISNTLNSSAKERLYANSSTVFFYVDGSYANEDLVVVPAVGIANATSFTNGEDNVDLVEYWIEATKGSSKNTVEAMLVDGVSLKASDIYYYNQNDFSVEKVEDGNYAINFNVHDDAGQDAVITYDGYETASAARTAGQKILSGYYREGNSALSVVNGDKEFTSGKDDADSSTKDEVLYGGMAYAVEATAAYDNYSGNLFAKIGSYDNYGIIFDDAKVVDLEDCGITTIRQLINAVKDGDVVEISYSYSTDTYEAGVVYITDYTPAGVTGPDKNPSQDIDAVAIGPKGNGTVTLNDASFTGTKTYDITLYEYSRDTASWEPVYSQDNMSLSFTGGVASLKLGGQMVNGERYMVEVDGVQSATVLANK